MPWDCYRHRAAIVDFAAGELDEPARTNVERHLSACPTCSAAVLELREVPAELHRRLAVEPSEAFWAQQRESILGAVERSMATRATRAMRPPVPAPRSRRRPLAAALRFGSLAAAAAAALIFVRTWSSPPIVTKVAKSETAAEVTAGNDSSTTTLEDA